MENKIESQPKTHSERIRALYELKQITGKPVTALLDQAILELAERHGTIYSSMGAPKTEEVKIESWNEYREYRELSDEMKYMRCLEELEKIKTINKYGGNR